MTISVTPMGPGELSRVRILPDAGFGMVRTDLGNLPLDRLAVQARISGLIARTVVVTEFVNVHETALEATYVFPLPDRAAVTGMTMTADDRTVEAELQERGAAREAYDQAIAAGQRASIAEEERPDVFTMRVGNIAPGERIVVELSLVGPLPFEDGAATFRFPLVVAPRYVPGVPLPGPQAGDGRLPDTEAVPDASRISPPVLLPGFPNPLRLSIDVDIDPAGLTLGDVRSSLHTVTDHDGRLSIAPGERADRDFVLRLGYAGGGETAIAVPDESAEEPEGVYQLVVLPPEGTATASPKDVVLLLDRSGSMGGWKMVAARRAAARVVDTLTGADRFAVLTFDHQIDRPADLGAGLSEASDRNRFRAVEHLAQASARGGTELLAPLTEGLRLLAGAGRNTAPGIGRELSGPAGDRDRVLVLVTDGQVGNEDQIVHDITPLIGATRIHTVGIDRAVNAGFLGRLAALGAGRAELVESEDRLDEAMEQIHRRISAPVVTGLSVTGVGVHLLDDDRSPVRMPGLYPGVPLVVSGRYAGKPGGSLTVTGQARDGSPFRTTVAIQQRTEPAVTAQWARARLRDLEDAYAAGDRGLEQRIVTLSLRHGVLCRFTAFIAVDSRVVNKGGETRRVTQPVELPSGWESPADAAAPMFLTAGMSASVAPPMPPAAPGGPRFAPARAEASDLGRAARPRQPLGFATAPAALRSGKAVAPAGSQPALADVRALAATEAHRLEAAAQRPDYERRELLEDLSSRLGVLITALSDPAVTPLRDLLTILDGDAPLPDKWAQALSILTAFSLSQPPPPPTTTDPAHGADADPPRSTPPAGADPGHRTAPTGTGPARSTAPTDADPDRGVRPADEHPAAGTAAPPARKAFWKR